MAVDFVDHCRMMCWVSRINKKDYDGGDGVWNPRGNLRNTGCFSCGGPHRQSHCRSMFQDNFPDTYSTQENNSLSNQLSSQDARVLLTIYPDFLAIPVSAPLKLGRGFVGKKK